MFFLQAIKPLTINQKQKANVLIQFNQEFLNKSIGDIFSENISTKYTNYPLSHNKDLIQDLLNDKDTILVPDGIGIVKAARMINYDVKERIAGIDIANKLLEYGNEQLNIKKEDEES